MFYHLGDKLEMSRRKTENVKECKPMDKAVPIRLDFL